MIYEILKIRLKQFFRILFEIGILRTFFLFGIVSVIILLMFIKLAIISNQIIITAVYIFLILSIHIKRKDKVFININASRPKMVFLAEYFLISLPLFLLLIYYQLWFYVILQMAAIAIILLLKIETHKSNINSLFQKIIPNNNFEWKAGIRKNLIPFIAIWFVGVLTSFFVGIIPISLFLLAVIILSFYQEHEPLQFLFSNELGAKQFLFNKTLNHLKAYVVITIPLILSYLIFNSTYYYIPLIEFLVFSLLLIYTILLKYAFYKPNNQSNATQIFSTIGIICIFFPFLFPLIIVLSIKFYFQAINNLNFYLNDFN